MARTTLSRLLFAVSGLLFLLALTLSSRATVLAVCDPNAAVVRASLDMSGGDTTGEASYAEGISANGRYTLFYSSIENLVANDGNGHTDLFAYDRQTCQTELISVNTSGVSSNSDTYVGKISGDGRYVAFYSTASDLVSGDTNGIGEYFLRDRQESATIRLAPSGVEPNNQPSNGNGGFDISSDGHFVVFASPVTNFLPDDTDDSEDLYLYDITDGSFSIVSRLQDGTKITDGVNVPSISSDGRYITFESASPHIVMPDTNGQNDIFLKDTQTGSIERITDVGGMQSDSYSYAARISGDGQFIAFMSGATNLVPGDTPSTFDVYLFDHTLNTFVRVSPVGVNPTTPEISADGHFVGYTSYASSIVPGDTNNAPDAFIYERDTGLTRRVSLTGQAEQANNSTSGVYLSHDASVVALSSAASNLVTDPVDYGDDWDVFVVQPALQIPPTPTHTPTPSRTLTPSPTFSSTPTLTPSRTSTPTATPSPSSTLTPSPTFTPSPTITPLPNVCAFDPAAQIIQRVSVASDGAQANERTYFGASVSTNGRWVGFDSTATNLVPNDTNGVVDVFVHDRYSCQTVRVSVSSAGAQANAQVYAGRISPDGRYMSMWSSASNLVANDDSGSNDTFIYDMLLRTMTRVSQSADGSKWGGIGGEWKQNGRYVVFTSTAQLRPEDTDFGMDYYAYEVGTGQLTLVNIPSINLVLGNSISDDLRYYTFSTNVQLVPQDTNTRYDVYVYDRQTTTYTLVSQGYNGSTADQDSARRSGTAMSSDDRYVFFDSAASNLIEGDDNDVSDIFRYDRLTAQTVVASVSSAGVLGNGESTDFAISPDGRYLFFHSAASNLIPLDDVNDTDAFIRDMVTGVTEAVSVTASGGNAYGAANSGHTIANDGEYAVYTSWATNLVANDTNNMEDVFVSRWKQIPLLVPGDELLIFGGFEDAKFERLSDASVTWLEYSENFGSPLCDSSCGDGGGTAGRRSGSWWVWFGGVEANELAAVAEPIRIPPNAAALHFWVWVGVDNATSASLTVYVDETPIYSLSKPFTGFRAGYAEVVLDMSAYADDAIHDLSFVSTTSGGVTNINFDDVSLIWLSGPPPLPPTLNGTVTLQGRPTPPDPRWVTDIQVRVEPAGGGTPILQTTITTDPSGAFTMEGLSPGTYKFWFKGTHTLAVSQTITLSNGSNPASIGLLREGDADNNNSVTITDFAILAASFGRTSGQPGYDARADFNGDGAVTITDFSLLAANFGQTGAT